MSFTAAKKWNKLPYKSTKYPNGTETHLIGLRPRKVRSKCGERLAEQVLQVVVGGAAGRHGVRGQAGLCRGLGGHEGVGG